MLYRGAEVLLCKGSISISTDEVRISPKFNYGENDDFIRLFILSYVKLLSDSPILTSSGIDKPAKVYKKFLAELCNSDIADVIKMYAAYSDIILSQEYSSGSYSSTRVYHKFMEKTPIYKEYLSWIRGGDPVMLTYILTFLRFGKKIKYEDPSMNATAFRGWLEVEERLESHEFNDIDLQSLKTIIAVLLPSLDMDTYLPKFGTGKVSEKGIFDVYDKLAKLDVDAKLAFAFKRPNQFNLIGEGTGLVKDLKFSSSLRSARSRLKFVTKDITKSRSICMEPNAYMYFQQEVLRHMVRAMRRGPIRRYVNLSDQTINRSAARHGSLYLSMDTIDLSSASDSVHVNLVKSVFPRDWLFYMLATRTSLVEKPDGSVTSVNKFAPMGSAVCFPTQCILFTAACIYAYAAHYHRKTTGAWIITDSEVRTCINDAMSNFSDTTPFGKRLESPVVYGDDIICDSRVTDDVILLLSRLGFEVNVGKSFTASQSFRESCGVYCYEGQDVTPLLFRLRFFKKGNLDASVYASLIEHINLARSRGYQNLATFWLSALRMTTERLPLPFVSSQDAFGLFTTSKGSHKPKISRWNAAWQITEEKVQGIGSKVPRRKAPAHHEQYRLDQWWRSRIGEDTTSTEYVEALRIRPQETRLVPTWARCE